MKIPILITIAFITVLLSAMEVVQIKIETVQIEEQGWQGLSLEPEDLLKGGAIRSLRALIADLLWIRVDDYHHHGQHYKILPLLTTVTSLQPKFIVAWTIGGWHMAFNIYHEAKTPEEKEKWLKEGIDFLKKGIIKNPDVYYIYFETAWIYFFKVHDYANAINYLKRAARHEHPQFVEHVLAHAYERNGQYQKSLEVWESIEERGSKPGLERVVRRMKKRLSKIVSDKMS